MTILTRLASIQNRRDEEPNLLLAHELVEGGDVNGIREIAANLWNKDKRIQSDCDSVLEEIGRVAPELIVDFTPDFLKLLTIKNNRMVWGAMINLSLIADLVPDQIFKNLDLIKKTIDGGSVITVDSGMKTLGIVASVKPEYNCVIFPYLIEKLKTCRPKSVAQYAESVYRAVGPHNQEAYIQVLNQRLNSLSASQVRRVKKLLKECEM